MSNKSHRLQKKAAYLFLWGKDDYSIMQELSIREGTLKRWKTSPVFLEEVARLQREWHLYRPMQMQRLIEHFLDAARQAMVEGEVNPKNLSTIFKFAQVFNFDGYFLNRARDKHLQTVPNRSETVPNSAENVPNGSGNVPDSAENVPVSAQTVPEYTPIPGYIRALNKEGS